jgi:predicted aspartyl protease
VFQFYYLNNSRQNIEAKMLGFPALLAEQYLPIHMMHFTVEPTPATRRAVLVGILGGMVSLILPRAQLYAAQPENSAESRIQSPVIGFKHGASGTSWLHFDMPDFRRVIVSGRINGVPARILLDSGVSGLVISKDLAAALRLRHIGTVVGVGVTGAVQGQLVEGVVVSLDNLTIKTPNAELYDMAPFAGVLNEPISALLGRDLFDSVIVDIDFAGVRIAFRDPNLTQPLPRGAEVPLQRDKSGLRGMPVSIENRPPIQATLDFGSDRALNISPAYASDQNLLRNRRLSTALSAGAAGIELGQVAVLTKVSIGNIAFHDVPIEVPNRWAFENQAILGMPIIRRMRMVIDFPHNRVFVLPNTTLLSRPFRKDRSGLGARRLTDRLQIMHVAAGSPAETSGLHAGDEIIEINDQKLDEAYFEQNPRIGSQPAGTVVYLTLSNNKRVKLTLADYY